ncbi:MAG: hypothetical protein R3350_04355, partial [Saprospiraceae bacterium]|nr:hypothetical protein [Saprospiraceae bacterium]
HVFRFSEVHTEQPLDGIIPDIILKGGKRQLIVEIAVTHPSEQKKIWQIRRMGSYAIEIDAWKIYRQLHSGPNGLHSKNYKKALISDTRCKRWLSHPKKSFVEANMRREADTKKVYIKQYGPFRKFIVSPCPANARKFRSDDTYADAMQDCMFCPHCLEITYEKINVGFREVPGRPERVYCLGRKSP